MLKRHFLPIAAVCALTAIVAGCGSAPPGAPGTAPAPAPVIETPPVVLTPPAATPAPAPAGGPRLAARDPVLDGWKQRAAERIHAANARQLFEGRPHHLLQGVIVADVTVDRTGRVTRLHIVRSPGIARLNNAVHASIKTASPLPAPPPALVKAGAMTYSETWLFTNDSRWRLRTLTLPQE